MRSGRPTQPPLFPLSVSSLSLPRLPPKQIAAIRAGLESVVPRPALALLTWSELERRVCGRPHVSAEMLRSVTRLAPTVPAKDAAWFWQVMEEISPADRLAFVAFVTGRKRLPSAAVDRGETLLTVDWTPGETRDQLLLRAGTCSSVFHLAPYSSQAVLKERLLTTVHCCQTIDGDGDLSAAQVCGGRGQAGWAGIDASHAIAIPVQLRSCLACVVALQPETRFCSG